MPGLILRKSGSLFWYQPHWFSIDQFGDRLNSDHVHFMTLNRNRSTFNCASRHKLIDFEPDAILTIPTSSTWLEVHSSTNLWNHVGFANIDIQLKTNYLLNTSASLHWLPSYFLSIEILLKTINISTTHNSKLLFTFFIGFDHI